MKEDRLFSLTIAEGKHDDFQIYKREETLFPVCSTDSDFSKKDINDTESWEQIT